MKRFPLHRRTRQIIASLAKKLGRDVPWCDLFAEIAELDEAVRKCFEPAELDCISILDEGVEVGGTRYYALSLNAEDWFEEWCNQFPNAPEMQVAGFLYASAHSMDPEALSCTWNDKFKLAVKVWLWRARCGIKRGQIAPLQRLLMPETPWPKSNREGEVEKEGYAGAGWLTATLGPVGGDTEFWRNKVPFLKALQKYRDASLYGESDKEVRNARWEQWKDMSAADEWRARKKLEDAWRALCGAGGPEPTNQPPVAEEAATGQPGASAGQAEPPPPAAPEFPQFGEATIKKLVMAKLAEVKDKKGA